MSFLWARMLWLLLAVPVLAAAYVLAQRRRKKYALRYASIALVREALGKGPGIRRHIPSALFLAAMAVLITALARPAAVVVLPSQQGTIILAMDSSGSMRAEDVRPSRLDAAKAAARAFVQRQPRATKIGVVAFAANAALVQPPTRDREAVLAAIDRLVLQRATAIGSGILASVNAILEDFGQGQIAWGAFDALPEEPAPLSDERYAPAVIVLLSDGQNNTGPHPLEVVRQASGRGIRIYTVGLGSPEGTVVNFYNRSFRVRLDEETLKAIADRTDGAYYRAGSEEDLLEVYRSLGSRLVFKRERTEITAVFAAAAAVLLLAAGALSLLWFQRLP